MILPLPAAFMAGSTACEHRNALVRLVLITLSHSSSESACGGLRILMPALLTRMSIRPSSRFQFDHCLDRGLVGDIGDDGDGFGATLLDVVDRCNGFGLIASDDHDVRASVRQSSR